MEFDLAAYILMGSVPFVFGFVQITKSFVSDSRLYPIMSLVFGIVLNLFFGWGIAGWRELIVMGIIAGLTASGAYSAYSAKEKPPQ